MHLIAPAVASAHLLQRLARRSFVVLRAAYPWLVICTLVPAALLSWWVVPKWQVQGFQISDEKQRGDLEDSFRKTITQLLAGSAVLIGTGFRLFAVQTKTAVRSRSAH
jgi:hypothetical protein